jgi:hypothetical protein
MKKFYIDDVLPPNEKHLATVFRRYPRTLAEAFPYDSYYANPIIHPLQDDLDWYSKIILNLVLVAAVVVLIFDLLLWQS